jgi:endonuclease/exonuclease/phosphatase (EEP) superfamily protein YafD
MLLATWNVLCDAYVKPEWYAGVPLHLLDPDARLEAVVRRALALEVDVLCLQEVDARCAEALSSRLGAVGYRGRWRQKALGKPDGCATFWRSREPLDEQVFVQPDDTGHVAQATFFKDVCVVTTHLKWSDPKTPWPERLSVAQAVALASWLSTIDGPVIVCGDLNAAPTDPVIARFADAGLRDVFDGADRPHTALSNQQTKKIDHVLARGLDVRPAATQFDQHGKQALPDEAEPSDHVPLLVEW